MNEKRAKFERLAEKRVSETIKKIRLVGNLANKHYYDYTDTHVNQIIQAIESELRALKNKFKEETSSSSDTFSFKF
jgi:Rad3-related DNA helicase